MPIFRRQDEAPRERTPEERERARAERAARRAGRGESIDFPAVVPELAAEPSAAEERPPAPAPPEEPPPRPPAPDPPPAPPPRPPAPEPPPAPPPKSDPPPPPPAPPEERPPAPPPPEPPPPREPPPAALQETAPFDPLTDDDLAPASPAADETPAAAASWEPEDDAPPAGEAPPADEAWDRDDEPFAPAASWAEGDDAAADDAAVAEPPPIVPPAARRARSGRVAALGDDADERPVPPKRITAGQRRTLPPTPPPPGTPAFSRRRRRRGRILAFLALLVLAGFAFLANLVFQPFKGDGGEEITVRIPPNSSIADVGDVLADKGIVDNAFIFTLRARLAGADLKAGTFRLRKDASYGATLAALDEDPAAPRTISIVIPEGRARSETAPLVEEAGLSGSYMKASRSHKGFRPRKYGAPRNVSLEGFLFPATYELRPGASAKTLVGQQLDKFEESIAEVDMRRARRRNLTSYDVLIIASMVEREASLAEERPRIAAVIHNRLRQGMRLGIDATIRYATKNWQRPIRVSELEMDSPYNTYQRTGLPPTPIGSPGLDSIRAAANPADVDDLFYVLKPCGGGAHNFSSTDAQFARDKAAYERKREELGGRSPVDC